MLASVATHEVLPHAEVMAFARLNEAIQRIRSKAAKSALVLES